MISRLKGDDHFVMYINTKSPCCTPEMNTVLSIIAQLKNIYTLSAGFTVVNKKGVVPLCL